MVKRIARLLAPADFGLAIQQARLARGLSQTDLANKIEVSQSTISEIEGGKTTIFLRRVLELAQLSGIEFTATWEDPSDGEEETNAPRG